MPERRRLALFLFDQGNDYQALLEQDCIQAARRHRLELTVFHADNSLNRQVDQIRNALASGSNAPDAVLVSPVSEVALMPMVHVAARSGVGWVFLNRWNDAISELRLQYPTVPIFSVSADQDQVGTLHGRQLARLCRPGDECVYIQGPLGTSSAKRRLAGTQRELSSGSCATLTILHSDWSRDGGRNVMTQWLRMLPRASVSGLVVVAQNDSMAVGARDALAEWDPGGASADIVGCDGSPEFGQQMVATRQLSATIVIPAVTSRAVDELIASDKGNRSSPEVPVAVRSFPDLESIRSLRVAATTRPPVRDQPK